MELELTSDQEQLRDAIRAVLDRESPITLARSVTESGAPTEALWQTFVELGWPSLTVPESAGGIGLGAGHSLFEGSHPIQVFLVVAGFRAQPFRLTVVVFPEQFLTPGLCLDQFLLQDAARVAHVPVVCVELILHEFGFARF